MFSLFKRLLIVPCMWVGLANGQVYVKMMDYRPTGEFGMVMKSRVGVELGYMKNFDGNRWRSNVGISYMKMKPRMASFPIYGTITDGNGTTVMPGTETFKKYNIFQLLAGGDFTFIDHDKFHPYVGMDVVIGLLAFDFTSNVKGISDDHYSGASAFGGLRFRLGMEYEINDRIGIFLTANREVVLVAQPASILGANDYGLGIRIQIGE